MQFVAKTLLSKVPRWTWYCAVSALLVWPAAAGMGQVQQQTAPGLPRTTPPGVNEPEPGTGLNAGKLEHMREDERRKRLLADTAKLVALTNQLNDEVNQSAKDELSLEVIRKAEEIEKLAHDVKERMKS